MRAKKNRYIDKAVKKMIKLRDLKPSKDAKGGVQTRSPAPHRTGWDPN